MHATALKRKLRNTQSQQGKNTFKWPFFTKTGKVGCGENNNECFISLKVETEKGDSGNRLKIIHFV